MRFSQTPPALFALLLTAIPSTVIAGPFPKDALHDLGFSWLMPRACDSYCGTENQFCCTVGQVCYTSAEVAICGTPTAAGNLVQATGNAFAASNQVQATGEGYAVYTFTYTETDLVFRTTTSTSWWQAAPSTSYVAPAPSSTYVPTVAGAPIICTVQGQTSCGSLCCAIDQMCGGKDQNGNDICVTRPESSYYPLPTTGTYSAPYRPTSGATVTATSVISATTTAPFLAPATASGSAFPTPIASTGGGGLSPGAIAGIVIGVIAGIILLILICFCCVLKAGFDGLLAIFGLGKKKRRSTERIETVEHYSRHGSGTGSRRETHGGWFGGGRPARVDSSRKKKSSGFGGLGAVGAGLAGLALVLGLKRKHDKEKPARSDVSSSYYTDSYTGTSASSASSDRRTRESRRH